MLREGVEKQFDDQVGIGLLLFAVFVGVRPLMIAVDRFQAWNRQQRLEPEVLIERLQVV